MIKKSIYSEKLGGFLTLENFQKELKIITMKGIEKANSLVLTTKKQKVFILSFAVSELH